MCNVDSGGLMGLQNILVIKNGGEAERCSCGPIGSRPPGLGNHEAGIMVDYVLYALRICSGDPCTRETATNL